VQRDGFYIESESSHSSLCRDGFGDSVSTITPDEWRTWDRLFGCFPGQRHDIGEDAPIEARRDEARQDKTRQDKATGFTISRRMVAIVTLTPWTTLNFDVIPRTSTRATEEQSGGEQAVRSLLFPLLSLRLPEQSD
jgi:hypothetical protein